MVAKSAKSVAATFLAKVDEISSLGRQDQYIISIDPGHAFFAFATLDVRRRSVVAWEVQSMDGDIVQKKIKSNKTPMKNQLVTNIERVKNTLDRMTFGIPQGVPWTKDHILVVIEKQTDRNQRMLKFQSELQMYMRMRGADVVILQSTSRDTYLGKYGVGVPSGGARHVKKTTTARFVQDQVLQYLPANLRPRMATAKKKDDLADSMVQLLATINKAPNWLNPLLNAIEQTHAPLRSTLPSQGNKSANHLSGEPPITIETRSHSRKRFVAVDENIEMEESNNNVKITRIRNGKRAYTEIY